MLAAFSNSVEAAKVILQYGGRVSARLYDGRTPLHIAAGYGHEGIVRALLDRVKEESDEEDDKEEQEEEDEQVRICYCFLLTHSGILKYQGKNCQEKEGRTRSIECHGSHGSRECGRYTGRGSY